MNHLLDSTVSQSNFVARPRPAPPIVAAEGSEALRGWLGLMALCVSWLFFAPALPAQTPGSNDASFNVLDDGTYGEGASSTIRAEIVLQPDGKILIGGSFSSFNGITRGRVARLDADGSVDASFNPGTGAGLGDVHTLALQPDGKVLIGGSFTNFNGTPRNRIARLNADGTLDTSFDPGSGLNGIAEALAIQPDGKVLIAGSFTSWDGIPRARIARVNSDGSLDASFDGGTGASTTIQSLILLASGKVLIGGSFTSYNGTPRNRIARLNADGSLDTTFDPGSGLDSTVIALVEQPDGKSLVAGSFLNVNGVAQNRIARLNADGSLDASFNVGSGAGGTVDSLALQPDGKVLIGGSFLNFNGVSRVRVARLDPDGTLDSTFDPGSGANNGVRRIALRPDGKMLIGGDFFSYGSKIRFRMARLNGDGSLDSSFNPVPSASGPVLCAAVQSDGRILLGGGFLLYNDVERSRIARLNSDGTLDAGFSPGSGANSSVLAIVPQPDGRVLLVGDFTEVDGVPRGRIARLNADGSLDAGFAAGAGASSTVSSLALQADGKVLIGGSFTSYDGVARSRIARLNTDGSLDLSFTPGTGASNTVNSIALQSDGRILIGGDFTIYDGVTRVRLARLNTDGSLDATFGPGLGANGVVNALAIQADGRSVIVGGFTSYNGAVRNRIARVNTDGSLDASFAPGMGPNSVVQALTLQPDGRVVIGGIFTAYDGTNRGYVARVNADGTLDGSFAPGSGANQFVFGLASQSDGKVILGGNFTRYDGVSRHRVARIHAYQPFTSYCDGPTLACPCGNSGTAGNGCGNSVNASGANLAASGVPSIAVDTLVLSGDGMPNSSALYFQGTGQSASAFGDGVRCASGAVIRLGTKINVAGASSYPTVGDQPVSVRGAVASSGERTYQVWYRNAAAFCTPSTFNLSNGIRVTWAP